MPGKNTVYSIVLKHSVKGNRLLILCTSMGLLGLSLYKIGIKAADAAKQVITRSGKLGRNYGMEIV